MSANKTEDSSLEKKRGTEGRCKMKAAEEKS